MTVEASPIIAKQEKPELARQFLILSPQRVTFNVEFFPRNGEMRVDWLASGLDQRDFLRILREVGCADGTPVIYQNTKLVLTEAERQIVEAYQAGELQAHNNNITFFLGRLWTFGYGSRYCCGSKSPRIGFFYRSCGKIL